MIAARGVIKETSAMDALETRYVRSGDVWIAYQVAGEGPFDVVYHPGAISHVELMRSMPTFQGRIADRLASFCRLIVFDQRGVGMSDRVSGVPTLETRMDDVRAVMDAVGSRRAAIVSMGVGVPMSLLFAATYPDRASALVLLRGHARELWAPDYPWGWTEERQRALVEALQRLFLASREEAAEALRALGFRYSDDDLAYFRRAAGSPGTIADLATMQREVDVRRVLPSVRVPALLVHNTEAAGAFPIGGARFMAERIPGARLVELPGEDFLGEASLELALDEAERFLRGVWEAGDWEEPEPDRVLATVLFTDIVDSSARAVALGDRAWRDLLKRHHEVVRRQLVRFRGKEVDTAGDGFLASFDGPARAIRCACAIVEEIHALGIELRAGLHTGECELVGGKVAGIAVHTGARVSASAAPGEVLVSSTVKDLVAGSEIDFRNRGVHELKGVPGEWHLFAVDRSSSGERGAI
jgi:class 3 adenylate cyclase/pimeloyl-ACP methyl ester carboxylesterase